MSEQTVDERISALEHEVARLAQYLPANGRVKSPDWRSTLGMFAGDAVMKEILDEGRKIRELDREHDSG